MNPPDYSSMSTADLIKADSAPDYSSMSTADLIKADSPKTAAPPQQPVKPPMSADLTFGLPGLPKGMSPGGIPTQSDVAMAKAPMGGLFNALQDQATSVGQPIVDAAQGKYQDAALHAAPMVAAMTPGIGPFVRAGMGLYGMGSGVKSAFNSYRKGEPVSQVTRGLANAAAAVPMLASAVPDVPEGVGPAINKTLTSPMASKVGGGIGALAGWKGAGPLGAIVGRSFGKELPGMVGSLFPEDKAIHPELQGEIDDAVARNQPTPEEGPLKSTLLATPPERPTGQVYGPPPMPEQPYRSHEGVPLGSRLSFDVGPQAPEAPPTPKAFVGPTGTVPPGARAPNPIDTGLYPVESVPSKTGRLTNIPREVLEAEPAKFNSTQGAARPAGLVNTPREQLAPEPAKFNHNPPELPPAPLPRPAGLSGMAPPRQPEPAKFAPFAEPATQPIGLGGALPRTPEPAGFNQAPTPATQPIGLSGAPLPRQPEPAGFNPFPEPEPGAQPPPPPMHPFTQAINRINQGGNLRGDDTLSGIMGNMERASNMRSGREFDKGPAMIAQMLLTRAGLRPGGVIEPGLTLQNLPRYAGESVTSRAPIVNGEQFNQADWDSNRLHPDVGPHKNVPPAPGVVVPEPKAKDSARIMKDILKQMSGRAGGT